MKFIRKSIAKLITGEKSSQKGLNKRGLTQQKDVFKKNALSKNTMVSIKGGIHSTDLQGF